VASIPSHAVFALALGACIAPAAIRRRAMLWGAALAVLPDSDAVGHWLGVPTRSLFGHRGLTHSLSFAVLVALFAALLLARRSGHPELRGRLGLYFVLAMVSHGMLDACTNGGPGIAFFAPFSKARYFFPFRPIAVSPIGVEGVFGERGLRILASEARWILLPSALLAAAATLLRSRGHARVKEHRPAKRS
jgi:inner membrane protein